MSAVRSVANYGDLIKDSELNVQAADAVAAALDEGAEFVAWLPEWLAEDKDLSQPGSHPRVVTGDIDHETEKAYLVVNEAGEGWLPKSQIRVFERADGAAISVSEANREGEER